MCALNKDISDEDKISDEQYFEKESNQFNICSEIGIFSEFNITNSDSYHSENFFKFTSPSCYWAGRTFTRRASRWSPNLASALPTAAANTRSTSRRPSCNMLTV